MRPLATGDIDLSQDAGSSPGLLTLDRVGKSFPNGTVALQDLTLEVRRGDFLSLLGPSGCGKSTALRLIADLTHPTTGQIEWHAPAEGAAATSMGPADIGFVFQEPTLMPWATVFENIFLPLKLKGHARRNVTPEIMDALERVHLEGFEKSYPRELSGGMRMRVSIARALVTKPSLLLMDEPFAALDEITRFKLNDDLLELWETSGWTVIFVTHSVFESVYLSNRVVVMAARPGRVFKELHVDAPYPRGEDHRTSPLYAEHCRAASEALHVAMEQ